MQPAQRIALLIGSINKDQPFLSGASAAAHRRGANLVCLVGKNINWKENHLSQGNVLYHLVSPQHYAGAVTWAGTGVGYVLFLFSLILAPMGAGGGSFALFATRDGELVKAVGNHWEILFESTGFRV